MCSSGKNDMRHQGRSFVGLVREPPEMFVWNINTNNKWWKYYYIIIIVWLTIPWLTIKCANKYARVSQKTHQSLNTIHNGKSAGSNYFISIWLSLLMPRTFTHERIVDCWLSWFKDITTKTNISPNQTREADGGEIGCKQGYVLSAAFTKDPRPP